MVAKSQNGLGDTESDSIYLRSFSALWLAMTVEESETIKESVLAYLAADCDLRGYDPIKGWNAAFRNEERTQAFFNGRNVKRTMHWCMAGRGMEPSSNPNIPAASVSLFLIALKSFEDLEGIFHRLSSEMSVRLQKK